MRPTAIALSLIALALAIYLQKDRLGQLMDWAIDHHNHHLQDEKAPPPPDPVKKAKTFILALKGNCQKKGHSHLSPLRLNDTVTQGQTLFCEANSHALIKHPDFWLKIMPQSSLQFKALGHPHIVFKSGDIYLAHFPTFKDSAVLLEAKQAKAHFFSGEFFLSLSSQDGSFQLAAKSGKGKIKTVRTQKTFNLTSHSPLTITIDGDRTSTSNWPGKKVWQKAKHGVDLPSRLPSKQ